MITARVNGAVQRRSLSGDEDFVLSTSICPTGALVSFSTSPAHEWHCVVNVSTPFPAPVHSLLARSMLPFRVMVLPVP